MNYIFPIGIITARFIRLVRILLRTSVGGEEGEGGGRKFVFLMTVVYELLTLMYDKHYE